MNIQKKDIDLKQEEVAYSLEKGYFYIKYVRLDMITPYMT